jgi:hypothetical protein
MKRIALIFIMGLLTLLLPIAAWADGIDITNRFGTVIFTNAGVTSNGSQLASFNGISAPPGYGMGSVKFSTGALISGNLWSGGTFSGVGSTFLVTSVGNWGQPKGTLFSGSFVGPVTWTLVSHPGPWDYVFTLSGTIQGQLWTGRTVTGFTTQTIFAEKNQWLHDQQGAVRLGKSQMAVPEPGTLGLLATGLIGVAGTMRRKLFGV